MSDPQPPPPAPAAATPPPGEPAVPGVWPWFMVYCGVVVLLALAVIGFGVVLLAGNPAALRLDPVEARVRGVWEIAAGIVLAVPFLAAPFLPRRPWVWVYDLVLIFLGVTACFLVPVSVALVVFWIRPKTKAFFRWT